MPYFSKILIANRGEIAVRLMRACRELGIATVAVYSEADRFALHTRSADEAVLLGPAPAHESYLAIDRIIAAAQATGAAAIHPGYGFLSENAAFAEACQAAGIVFIGPSPAAIRLMGSKIAAKDAVQAMNVPTIPGYQGADQAPATLLREAQKIGFPVMIKAAAGGGGKGMRAVDRADDFPDALAAAQREALGAFGDGTVFLEKLVVRPRHIEFQIMADQHGHTLYFGERECSIQRRHQKIIEEAPSIALTPELRAEMGAAAVRAAQSAQYVNAGTVEFMLDQEGRYYFLEMNTRLQVEHPVTEQVLGHDLAQLQIAIAAGAPLTLQQSDLVPRGHAIEVRLYAEDPVTGLPATGKALVFDAPRGPGLRLDSGLVAGDEVTMYYDPMLAKLIVTGDDRPMAVARLSQALNDLGILGLTTNVPLLRQICADERFQRGATFTDFLSDPRYTSEQSAAPTVANSNLLLLAAAIGQRELLALPTPTRRSPWEPGVLRSSTFTMRTVVGDSPHHVSVQDDPQQSGAFFATVDDQPVTLDPASDAPLFAQRVPTTGTLILRHGNRQQRYWLARRPEDGAMLVADGHASLICLPPAQLDVDRAAQGGKASAGQRHITAPMAGTVIQVRVAEGDTVAARQTLVILTAMKMEHNLIAPGPAKVRRVTVKEGDVVTGGATLIELEATE
jgi:3-methylcrotonyl-CoA carboxylase alpha subunit